MTWHDMSQGTDAADRQPARRRDRRRRLPGGADRRAASATPATARCRSTTIGELVTLSGDQVLGENGPIVLQPTDRDIAITKDGTIKVREGNSLTTDSHARQAAARDVRPIRSSCARTAPRPSRAPDGAAPMPLPEARANVVQGAIEKSNVRPVVEMTRMIELTRAYTQVATILQQQGEHAKELDRATRRSSGLVRRRSHACTAHRGDRNDGPGTQRPGHLQQHRQHAHDRLQAPARGIPGSALRARQPRRHADLDAGQHPAGRHRSRRRRQDRRHAAR